MQQILPSISPSDLHARLGTASAPIVVDVRRPADFAKAGELIVSAFHRPPDDVERWQKDLPSGRKVVVHCVHGREVSQGVAAALRAAGVDAVYLQDGIEGWIAKGLPTHRTIGATPGKWVTREHPKIDRIACPWLIRRFIDPQASFKFVSAKGYRLRKGEMRFDMFEAEFTHEGDRCTYEVLLLRSGLKDKALAVIGEIVHDIDLKDAKFAREEASGIARMIDGFAAAGMSDVQRLERGAAMFDDLYAYFRGRRPGRNV
jgi:rhodanese-related sulfurtransferase